MALRKLAVAPRSPLSPSGRAALSRLASGPDLGTPLATEGFAVGPAFFRTLPADLLADLMA
ncbi:MAG TPA: hypothetical protein VLC53_15615, partial [Myxococcota bacterium]|nr:hypothetical protein [Myxococcota bacterium]